jgi:hypothetical protein
VSIQIANPAPAIPLLHRAMTGNQFRGGMNIDYSVSDRFDESRETVQAVRMNSITTRLGKQARAQLCSNNFKADVDQDPLKCALKFWV